MPIYRYGYKWEAFKAKLPYKQYPKDGGLYLIRIRNTKNKCFKCVYVGHTSRLQSRIASHLVISCIYKNLHKRSDVHEVQILFCATNINKYERAGKERGLIKRLKPLFNTQTMYNGYKNYIGFKSQNRRKNKFRWLLYGYD